MRVIGINQTIIPEVDIFVATATSILTLLGVVANGLILVAIATQKRLHKRANALFFSLALLDFLACALNGPYSIITYYTNKPWPNFATCRGMLTFGIATSLTSCLFSAFISVNGLFGIMLRKNTVEVMPNKILVASMTVTGWLFLVVMTVVPFVYFNGRDFVSFQPRLGVCYISENDETTAFAITAFLITALSWVISLTCYLKIANIVRKSNNRVAASAAVGDGPMPRVNQLNPRNRHLIKLVHTIFVTFLLYIIFFIPLLAVEALYRTDYEPHYLVYRTVCMILWSISAINPCIYIYRLRDFREAVLKLLRKCCACCKQPGN